MRHLQVTIGFLSFYKVSQQEEEEQEEEEQQQQQ